MNKNFLMFYVGVVIVIEIKIYVVVLFMGFFKLFKIYVLKLIVICK